MTRETIMSQSSGTASGDAKLSWEPKRVCIVGSGNWGSAICRIVGANAKLRDEFAEEVRMWVFEEEVEGRKLTEIINTDHENVKYLPGYKLPENVIAVPDLLEAAQDADILIFVIPHQFLPRLCTQLKGNIKSTAVAISLIKGFHLQPEGGMSLLTALIKEHLEIQTAALMGANLANEVAAEHFCESTIGCSDLQVAFLLKNLFQTPNFRISVTQDSATVEICGALKNIVACGAGFADGLGLGDNTKAAIIRLGLMEMVHFVKTFYPESQMETFFESCGVADLITTCYGGRNRKCSEAFARTGKPIEEIERELLNGQKLQGPETAREVHTMLVQKNLTERYPMFVNIHLIFEGGKDVKQFIDCLRAHPAHV